MIQNSVDLQHSMILEMTNPFSSSVVCHLCFAFLSLYFRMVVILSVEEISFLLHYLCFSSFSLSVFLHKEIDMKFKILSSEDI